MNDPEISCPVIEEALKELEPLKGKKEYSNLLDLFERIRTINSQLRYGRDANIDLLKSEREKNAELTRKGELLCHQNGNLLITNHKLRAALEFYADSDNYEVEHVTYPEVINDNGDKARSVLAEIGDEK